MARIERPAPMSYEQALMALERSSHAGTAEDYEWVEGLGHTFLLDDGREVLVGARYVGLSGPGGAGLAREEFIRPLAG